jgi:hypothetical protein
VWYFNIRYCKVFITIKMKKFFALFGVTTALELNTQKFAQ